SSASCRWSSPSRRRSCWECRWRGVSGDGFLRHPRPVYGHGHVHDRKNEMLEIKKLHAGIDGKEILKGLSLKVGAGEVHASMGPNGSGKSTLANVLAGRPRYEVTSGEVLFEGKNLLELPTEERAREGV